MSATSAITPVGRNNYAIDYLCPKTASSEIKVRQAEGGVDYFSFDGVNSRIKINKITSYSGSVIDFQAQSLSNITGAQDSADAISAGQVQRNLARYNVTSGTQPAYTLAPTVPWSSGYADGCSVVFRAHATNTAAPTLNIDSQGAVNITRSNGVNLRTGEIQSGGIYEVVYSSALSKFVLLNASFGVDSSSWTPTMSGFGGMTISNIVVSQAEINQVPSGMDFNLSLQFDTGGTLTDIFYVTNFPVPGKTGIAGAGGCAIWGGGGYHSPMWTLTSASLEVRKLDGAFGASNPKFLHVSGNYRLP